MNINSKYQRLCKFIKCSLVMMFFICIGLNVQDANPQEEDRDEIPKDWVLVPRISVALEYGGFAFQQYNYTSMLRRYLEVDLLQYRHHIFYLLFDEKTYFGVPGNSWEFNLMKFDAVLGGYRYDFGKFYLGLFLHHRCNNIFLTSNYHDLLNRERANIYDIGLEILTKNLRVGMEDRNINFNSSDDFEYLGKFAGGFWVSKAIVSDRIYLKWLIRAKLRYDILRYKRLIPYLEVSGDAYLGPDNKIVPSVELGIRYHLSDSVDITPFFKWSRDQLALTTSLFPIQYPFITSNYLYGGVRLEALLTKNSFQNMSFDELKLLTGIHGQAGYSVFINNPNFNGHGDIQLYLQALEWRSWTLFIDTNMNLNTRSEDFKPDKITYTVQYGLTYYWKKYFLEGFVSDQVRLDSNIFRGPTERNNLLGLRSGTKGMKPGYYDFGVSFNQQNFQWLNNWQGQASAGHAFQNQNWPYLWDFVAQVRWDVFRLYFAIPYIQSDINWRIGGSSTKDSFEYAIEPGVRFHGVYDLAIYYRFQHLNNNLIFPGPYQNQNLIGIKVLF